GDELLLFGLLALRLRLFIFASLRLLVFLAWLAVGRIRTRSSGFPGVVRYVPSCSFELHRWRRNQLFHYSTARRALLNRRIGKLPDLFKAMTAFFALILVKWHAFRF